jgi:hypothetical protein
MLGKSTFPPDERELLRKEYRYGRRMKDDITSPSIVKQKPLKK